MRLATATLPLFLLVPSLAGAATWEIDPSHTRVGFRVSHMMVSSVEGHFTGVKGTLDYEPGALQDLSVEVVVDTSTVDTGNADRDGHLRSPDFLDVAAHPAMSFTSTRVKTTRRGGFEIHGDLTIRGVTKPVVLEATGLGNPVTDPWGNQRLGASATTVIDRQDFGVSWNDTLDAGGLLVGDDLTLRIDVEFVRAPDAPAVN